MKEINHPTGAALTSGMNVSVVLSLNKSSRRSLMQEKTDEIKLLFKKLKPFTLSSAFSNLK